MQIYSKRVDHTYKQAFATLQGRQCDGGWLVQALGGWLRAAVGVWMGGARGCTFWPQQARGTAPTCLPSVFLTDDEEEGGDSQALEEGGDPAAGARKKRRGGGNTQESDTLADAESLKMKEALDASGEVDPLFHRTCALFDEGGAKGARRRRQGVCVGGRGCMRACAHEVEACAQLCCCMGLHGPCPASFAPSAQQTTRCACCRHAAQQPQRVWRLLHHV